MTPTPRNCLVVGAGIGGIGAAIALSQRGENVDIIDIRRPHPFAGVGIDQPGNSLRMLDELGVLDDCLAKGFTYDGNTHFTQDGTTIIRLQSTLGDDRVPANNGLSRQALHDTLMSRSRSLNLEVQYGVTVHNALDDGELVHVEFSDGSRKPYDLVACFDGIRSTMRDKLFGTENKVHDSGFSVWRVSLPRKPEVDRALIFHGNGSSTGVIPISPDHMYLFHVSPTPTEDCPDGAPSLELSEKLAEYGGLASELSTEVRDKRVIRGLLQEVKLDQWAKGRIILLGDAAHASLPTLTQGAAMALEDGVILAKALDTDAPIEESLHSVEGARKPRASMVQNASRKILAAEMAVQDNKPDDTSITFLAKQLEKQVSAIEDPLNVVP